MPGLLILNRKILHDLIIPYNECYPWCIGKKVNTFHICRMKRLTSHFIPVGFVLQIILLISCGSHSPGSPGTTAAKIEQAITASRPGTTATTGTGYTMTAVVNGRSWSATSMLPPSASDRIIGYFNDDYIGLPYAKKDMVAGKKQKLGPDNAIDVFVSTAPGGWLTTSGEITITKADAQWVEGEFACSMKSTEGHGSMEVTGGFFRIPAAGSK